mmetsp:Transcript_14708/g.25896  ORF Transcript_14708/g.25896 Transcript_14708/m.25896 type:complete len:214 (-) Transcript_14708:373-1014(-)
MLRRLFLWAALKGKSVFDPFTAFPTASSDRFETAAAKEDLGDEMMMDDFVEREDDDGVAGVSSTSCCRSLFPFPPAHERDENRSLSLSLVSLLLFAPFSFSSFFSFPSFFSSSFSFSSSFPFLPSFFFLCFSTSFNSFISFICSTSFPSSASSDRSETVLSEFRFNEWLEVQERFETADDLRLMLLFKNPLSSSSLLFMLLPSESSSASSPMP